MLLSVVTWVLAGTFVALGLFYGYAWLKGGNGIWRWGYESLAHRDRGIDVNTPLYGNISLVCLALGAWYFVLASGIDLSSAARLLGRTLTAVPIIALFVVVALVRRPVGRH